MPAPTEPEAPSADLTELQRCVQKLQAERQALAAEHGQAGQQLPGSLKLEQPETAKLRSRLDELLAKAAAGKAATKAIEPPGTALPPPAVKAPAGNKEPAPKPIPNPGQTDQQPPTDPDTPLNPLALAHVLYKSGNYEQALKAYRMVNLTGVGAEERAPVQYLMAVCLRKLGKMEQATAGFREVVNMSGDEHLAACAQWQLVHLRSLSELNAQLKDLRERRKALEALP
jgi:tetratricopeptide (TPR) repeat protein